MRRLASKPHKCREEHGRYELRLHPLAYFLPSNVLVLGESDGGGASAEQKCRNCVDEEMNPRPLHLPINGATYTDRTLSVGERDGEGEDWPPHALAVMPSLSK